LLFQFPEFSLHLWISAFTSKPNDFDAILRGVQEKYPTLSMQFVDLDRVPGSRYLFLATLNALKSFRSKQPIAKTLGMEILLYVSANRQITEAIRLVGITPNTERIGVILVGKTEGEVSGASELVSQILDQKSNDELIDYWSDERTENVLSLFEIGSKELKATLRKNEAKTQAVERLAIERSALLTVRK
jgi:tRNA threonylcarbamoyladenosine modification (KEOPS) complex Cgi121 subunit